ncbi:MAG: ABC transporter substrate-binding protein [Clostridiales bacterium]|nr:ABC transporter substrate-binding protein [Clostridiales bacterium]
MKSYIAIGLAFVLSLGVIVTGCNGAGGTGTEASNNNGSAESVAPAAPETGPAQIRLGGLKGPTTIGMVKLLEDAKAGETEIDYLFTIAGAADELTPALIRGELDIVAIPANLASVLYNNTGGAVQLLAVNTLGVTYIVDTGEEIASFADLKGKTVYCTGKGAVPEFALRYLLKENGVDPDSDLTLEWKSEPPEVVAILAQSGGVAMLPQPYVTVAQNALPGLRIALDMTTEWNALDNGSMLITGVLAVNRDFAQTHPDPIQKFLEEYKASTEFVNANASEAAVMVEAYDIVKAPIAEIAIPYCNIVYLDGEEMEKAVSGYLEVLYTQNPKSVGETLPGDDFYYKR